MSQCGSLKKEAWEALRKAVMYHRGKPIGTIAATTVDPLEDALNYNQVIIKFYELICKILVLLLGMGINIDNSL